jgi:hypothetical protein
VAKAITNVADDRAKVRHRALGDLWLTSTARRTGQLLGDLLADASRPQFLE